MTNNNSNSTFFSVSNMKHVFNTQVKVVKDAFATESELFVHERDLAGAFCSTVAKTFKDELAARKAARTAKVDDINPSGRFGQTSSTCN